MNTGHMPSTMLTSRRHRLTSQVAKARLTISASASRPWRGSNMSQGTATIAGLHQQHLHVSEYALRKTAFAVAKVVLPHAHEGVVVAQRADAGQVGPEIEAPVRQRGGVVRTDVVHVEHTQVAGACDGLGQRGDGGNAAAREDVALDEVH